MTLTNNTKTTLIALGATLVVGIGVAGFIDYRNSQEKNMLDPGWTLVSTADNGDLWYVNDASISYENNRYVEAWIMNNQAKKDSDGTRSFKALSIFDCSNGNYRWMQLNSAAGQNGHGATTGTEGAGPVRTAPPGSNIANISEYLCKPLYNNQSQPSSDTTPEQSRTDTLKQI